MAKSPRSSTTIKLSTDTRDRLRAMGGETYEETIIEALDALEAQQFWAEADAAEAWERSLSVEEREELRQREAELSATWDRNW